MASIEQHKYSASGHSPGDIKQMPDGSWRICLVGVFAVAQGEYETALRWYVPKTGQDCRRVREVSREASRNG